MQSVYIIDSVRSPVGKYAGALANTRPDDLLAFVIKALVQRNPKVNVDEIEDVIAGCSNQAGEDNRNVARMASLLAGLPVTVAGNTVNRLCGSGLQAIMDASRSIIANEGKAYIAAGVESMTRAPFVMPKSDVAFSRKAEIFDTTMGWRFINKKMSVLYHPYSMGETAENVANQWKISRQEQDQFAFNSQQKYFKALDEGKWENEIIPIETTSGKDVKTIFNCDEHPRKTSLDKLAQLNPAFVKEGSVTAGNSSGINDGSAAMLLVNEEALKTFGLSPMARVVSMAVAGVDPSIMGIGPVPATQKALRRAGLKPDQLDIIELNEAFASQCISCIKELDLDPVKINVNGGSIAIGHPLGASGVRISTTLLHEMKRKKYTYGLATMCVGVGQGAAIIYENLSS